jgi:hypothetical protein
VLHRERRYGDLGRSKIRLLSVLEALGLMATVLEAAASSSHS